MKLPLFRVYLLATMALLPGILHIFNWYLQNHYLEKSILLETNSSQEGKVNIDIWQDICSLSINSLRQFPLFPHFPNKRKFMIVSRDSIKFNFKGKFTAIRIMGYLHPTKTGYYVFYLNSPTLGQLWLSNTTEPMKAVRIAYTSLNIIKTLSFHVGDNKPVSEAIFLRRGSKYYFEILHALNDPIQQNGEVILYWMLPGTALFTNITGNHVSEYSELLSFYKTPETFEEEDENEDDILPPSLKLFEDEDKPLREVYPLDKERTKKSKIPIFTLKQDYIKAILGSNLDLDGTEYNRETVRILPYMDRNKNDVIDAFPNCKYDPTYYTKSWNVSRYEGIRKSVFVDIFPSDETNLMRFGPVLKESHVNANDVIKEKDVVQLVKYFMDELNKNSGRIYLLHSITNIEQYSPKELKGGKYLLELVLRTRESDKLYRFSEFFFQKMNQIRPSLCFLENMRWKTNVWINVILNASGQSGWVVYYVKQMAQILKETHDDHVTFIIVDYGNDRIDIGKEMIRNGIKRFSIIKRNGTFHKTATINLAASQIEDPNSIVFLTDLHFKMPLNLFDVVRKHTIQGKMAFSPILTRLAFCGRPRTKYVYSEGFYEPYGFGVFSVYKSDWDSFGGMNEKEFKNKWGGEDWEMVDRVINKGYEIEKLRLPGFYHFYHNRKGMWNEQ